MTCCQRGGMLVLRKIWRWGQLCRSLGFYVRSFTNPVWCGFLIFSLFSPLQENKQSPLLSIEEIQNGIQSQDGYKQLQVGPPVAVSELTGFEEETVNVSCRRRSLLGRFWAGSETRPSTWWSTLVSCPGSPSFDCVDSILSIRCKSDAQQPSSSAG